MLYIILFDIYMYVIQIISSLCYNELIADNLIYHIFHSK